MSQFYAKGEITFDTKLREKIKRDASPCWWHKDDFDKGENLGKDFTGYIDENGEVFDICSILYIRDLKREREREQKIAQKFYDMQNKVLTSTKKIEKFCSQIDKRASIKSGIRKLDMELKKGYVMAQTKIGGGKKKRRYKKDNRRFLTDREIENRKNEKAFLETEFAKQEEKLELKEFLYEILNTMWDITKDKIGRYHLKYGYYNTEGIYMAYERAMESLKNKINSIKDNEKLLDLEEEEKDEEVKESTYFQEIKKVLIEDIKEERENYTVRAERTVTNRARYFVNSSGERIEIKDDVRQVVLNKN